MKSAPIPCLITIFVLLFGLHSVGQKTNTPPNQPRSKDYSFTMKSSPDWSDTGIDLYPGDRIHIYGPITTCEGPVRDEKEHLILASAPAGALLAKLYLEADPIPASPDAEVPVIDRSHLYLAVNDLNCHGTIPVRVHVERH